MIGCSMMTVFMDDHGVLYVEDRLDVFTWILHGS